MTAREYLCIYLPTWSTDLLKQHRKDSPNEGAQPNRLFPKTENLTDKSLPPIILYTKTGSNRAGAHQITAARFCRKALAAGVRTGMPLSTARMLATENKIEPICLEFNADEDFIALCRLAAWAIKFSPLISIDEDLFRSFREKTLSSLSSLHNGLIIDITGTEKLHKGWPALASRLLQAFDRRNIEARIAIAPTAGAAWALSRFSRTNPAILDRTALIKEAISPLPLASLRLPRDLISSLKQLGLQRISDLLKLPRESLAERFGPQLLMRMEQALGCREEALRFIKTKEGFETERNFEIPLTRHATLQSALLDLFRTLLKRLEDSGKTASTFRVEVYSLDRDRTVSTFAREIALYHASTKESHIASVIAPVIEKIRAGEGITKARVTAHLISEKTAAQRDLVKDAAQSRKEDLGDAGGELLNHLMVRLGRDRVLQVSFEASWIPEKSFAYKPLGSKNNSVTPGLICSERPPYFLNPPQPASVVALLPDAPPAQIAWQGQRLKIAHGSGPERISSEWWHSVLDEQSAAEARDYFKVQDETGRWLWVFRDQLTSSWFVHGMWV